MNKPNRKTLRVKWDSYQNGCYFVTVCTQDKTHYFGEIKNQKMYLSSLGMELQKIIQNTINLRADQFIEIPITLSCPIIFI